MPHTTFTKEERQKRIMVERSRNPRITRAALATMLSVDESTIKRDIAQLRDQGQLLKEEIPRDPSARSRVLDMHVDNYEMANKNIYVTDQMAEELEQLIRTRDVICPKCKEHFPYLSDDPKRWDAYFNARATISKQVELNARLLNQLSDDKVLMAYQLDADVQLILQKLYDLAPDVARQLFVELVQEDERRRRRMPEFVEIVSTPQLPEGSHVHSEAEVVVEGEFTEQEVESVDEV